MTSGEAEAHLVPEVPDDLLDAVLGIAGDLGLSHTLRRIVQAAVSVVDARYGALGVMGADGLIQEFIVEGIDDDDAAALGSPPQGKGILGLLIRDQQPLRLPDLTQHAESVGFPPGHPPMHSFLGVPIRVRE